LRPRRGPDPARRRWYPRCGRAAARYRRSGARASPAPLQERAIPVEVDDQRVYGQEHGAGEGDGDEIPVEAIPEVAERARPAVRRQRVLPREPGDRRAREHVLHARLGQLSVFSTILLTALSVSNTPSPRIATAS